MSKLKMKLKHLLALAAMAASGTAWAQTDVTSEYLTNPDFEGSYTPLEGTGVTTDRAIYQPEGWTVTNLGSYDKNDITILNSGDLASNNFKSITALTGGDKNTYLYRGKWGKTTYFKIHQTANLPEGDYELTCDAWKSGLGGNSTIYADDKSATLPSNETAWKTLSLTFSVLKKGNVEIGFTIQHNSDGSEKFLGFDNFKLYYKGIDLTNWNEAKTAAQTALDTYDSQLATIERQAVVDAMSASAPTSIAEKETMVADLNTKVATYKVKAENEMLMAEKKSLTDAIARIKTEYPNSSNEVLNTDISKWTNSTYTVMDNNQHWSGAAKYKYYEQSSAQWGQNAWSIGASQTVNLPAGKYAFVVTARASGDVTSTMTVDGTQVALCNKGDVGYGIATDGEATFDMTKNFANDGKGRGWEYAYVEFEVTEARDVTFSLASSTQAKYNWVSIADPVLYYNDDAKVAMENVKKQVVLDQIAAIQTPADDAIMNATTKTTLTEKKQNADNASLSHSIEELNTIKAELEEAVNAANASIALYTEAQALLEKLLSSANTLDATGQAAFENNATYTDIKAAYDERTLESLTNEQKTALKDALKAAVKAQDSENAVFTLVLENPSFEEGTNGWINIRNTTGTYDYRTAEENPAEGTKSLNAWASQINYIHVWQKVTLPAGTYTLSAKARTNQNPKDTRVRTYINGKNASNSNYLTFDANVTWNSVEAWVPLTTTFSIIEETEVEMGIYSWGQNIQDNQQGFFQVDDFQLVRNGNAPTSYARTTTTGKYGTICLPYAANADGATVYNAEVDNGYVTLTETESMEAGKPYIYQATAETQTFTYAGAPVPAPIANDPLTGVFTETAVPVGSYVLQTHNDEQMFYIVEEGAQPTLSANKAYLTAPSAGVNTLAFADNTTTAIQTVEALTTGKAAIYDLNGRQLKQLQKGVNIVNGVKVLVK